MSGKMSFLGSNGLSKAIEPPVCVEPSNCRSLAFPVWPDNCHVKLGKGSHGLGS